MDLPWITVLSIEELSLNSSDPETSYRVVEVGGFSILVGVYQARYFAVENRCTHEDLPLEGGELEAGQIFCPHHGASFCLQTGAVRCPPAYEALRLFPVRVQGSAIQIQLKP
jgi:3-phenylpropionate/trans-cinnamate dioxygenase ferredoxin component